MPPTMRRVRASPYFIFYDGHCRICTRSKQSIQRLAPASADLRFVDINDAAALSRFPMVDSAATVSQIFVLDPAGRLRGGYDGLVSLLPAMPGGRWASKVLGWAPIRRLGDRAYRWVAANRYRLGGSLSCEGGACRL